MTIMKLLGRLKTPDLTAWSGKKTLRERMGYADVLLDLRRALYWDLAVDASEDAAVGLVNELCERAIFFANPISHTFEIRLPSDNPPRLTAEGGHVIEIMVNAFNDGSPSAKLRQLQRIRPSVRSLEEGVLWTLHLVATDRKAAEKIAWEIAVRRRINEGFLSNPHFQQAAIL